MKSLLTSMLPVGASIPHSQDEVEYSFAMEYHGPPVTYDLPRAVPIDIKRIPTATVVPPTSLSDKLSLPIAQPLIAPDPSSKNSKELTLGFDKIVSPTSVIAFHQRDRDGPDCGLSGEFSSSGTLAFSNGHDQSCELSVVVDGGSGALNLSNEHEGSQQLSGGIGISRTLECFSSRIESHELSGSSGAQRASNDCKESLDFLNDIDQPDWGSTESMQSSRFLSSEVSSCKDEDFNNDPPCHAKRTSIVTFLDAESSDTIHGDFSPVEGQAIQEQRGPETRPKKGACYRCSKGNLFTDKETCIVCNKKYCSNCILRAMGSMPEGRKCVTCIGLPIDESKRESLGKCSRVLKWLLNELEIQQIMKAEKSCEVNQLQAELIYVNRQQLCPEELILLQSCPKPPKKLKPGKYWYDKVSGLWGKEGQKPCNIISPNLNVGGAIMPNASNGNTRVSINNREVTKAELWMLQLAGVQCAGNPNFWVDADGSYQEEGQKNIKGHIWGKSATKLVCAVLSLPVPSKATNPCREEKALVDRPVPDYLEQRTLQKLLLVGYSGSGTSTIFKQAKFLYKSVSFSEDERQDIKLIIQSNVYKYLGILLEGRERFEEESQVEMKKNQSVEQSSALGNASEHDEKTIYSIGPRLKAFSDWLLKVMVSGNLEAIFPAATREYAPLVEELWKDAAIQATYKRRTELQMLPVVASYFLERAVEISRMDYEPSDEDILYAEGITSSNGLACMDFSFPHSGHFESIDTADQHDSLLRYQLIRVPARGLGENCKWLEMFEDVRLVIFCVALSDYDQFCDDGNEVLMNKMLASRKLFEIIVTHPTFKQMEFLLILNKFDLLEEKIEQVPLTSCEWFHDFNPVRSYHHSNSNTRSNSINNNNPSLAQLAFYYIAVKFKRLFASLTGRKLYVSLVKGLESGTVDGSLRYAREILKWDEGRENLSINELSYYSTEASSFSS
ncbi:PREDICTED: extra-large guanine nucleotide-binding protein 1-like [Nelumbo nucifera]|uniref:Extra-large guanine nucleotide-binding protein 1-like n=1 Tax=Nelumbo nucifera TaxID=4432 RepID=A0A1U7ZLU8_NELNU|nr:PREDICTED: extra-large guanine nucleotide-binding protein 1-like [Nelumbo nucifera]XP_019053036.1 PREDICTED: extra-large guanine nucleotide-binding protein 1-like [Nelumbo nucifera]